MLSGAPGTGKSVLVRQAFQGATGVVHIDLDAAGSGEALEQRLMAQLRTSLGVPEEIAAKDCTTDALAGWIKRAVKEQKQHLTYKKLIIVVDIQGSLTSEDDIRGVYLMLETLCKSSSTNIIISSCKHFITHFRHKSECIGDLDVDSANELLNNLGVFNSTFSDLLCSRRPSGMSTVTNDELRKFIFATVGLHVGTLVQMSDALHRATGNAAITATNPTAIAALKAFTDEFSASEAANVNVAN